ncbi:conserved hypothetical protein [Neospora caninum Liverpool]|nr:conserved hypothetical protein [Neospora caninum Liverpool]CBZ50846.1 conserved hypothetical protein [Neospora caninum Liverpool]|eukprot:XP_003880879.1 conserved hypothetical protein [Neospora caninum Liverpool]
MATCVIRTGSMARPLPLLLEVSFPGVVWWKARALSRWPFSRRGVETFSFAHSQFFERQAGAPRRVTKLTRRAQVSSSCIAREATEDVMLWEGRGRRSSISRSQSDEFTVNGRVRSSVPDTRPGQHAHSGQGVHCKGRCSTSGVLENCDRSSPVAHFSIDTTPFNSSVGNVSLQPLWARRCWSAACCSAATSSPRGIVNPAAFCLRLFSSTTKQSGKKVSRTPSEASSVTAPTEAAPQKKDFKKVGGKESFSQSGRSGKSAVATGQVESAARPFNLNGWSGADTVNSLAAAEHWEPSRLTLKQHQQVVVWKKNRTCILCKKEVQGGSVEKVETACEKAWRFLSGYSRSAHVCPILP